MRQCVTVLLLLGSVSVAAAASADEQFEAMGARYMDEFAKFSPVGATGLGDHRYDDQLDNVDAASRATELAWMKGVLQKLDEIPVEQLSRANQVDAALLKHDLRYQIWRGEVMQEWAWNPLRYTGLAGTSIYALTARDFAPLPNRLDSVARRLEQLPRFLSQVRASLQKDRVPREHAETAAKQNRGILSIIRNTVEPELQNLSPSQQVRLRNAIDLATTAVEEHQVWMDEVLLPAAQASYRLPVALYDQKLAFALHSDLTREDIRQAAEQRVRHLHEMMYDIAVPIYRAAGQPLEPSPNDARRRDVIRFALERAYRDAPTADTVVETAKDTARVATDFLRKHDLVSLMPDPLEIVLMPEFRRGVSMAYCDSPGPLDKGQKTFYVVSPIPDSWTEEQTHSYLREYNKRSLHVLTIHEALPGHFLQLAHSNRYPGQLRHLFHSGAFIEGWACYAEWMMCEQGYLEHDPLMKLITLKWYLRDAMNAIIDSAVHIDGISREEAVRRMMDEAFQEEREAAGKWTRAQLTSVQLSTYFVGYTEHVALRKKAEEAWGERFRLKEYHDRVLSYGSPPVRFVGALLLDQPIPRD